MATTGTGTIDFGAAPGASDASLVITGQAAIVAGSLVEAWLRPVATADHSVDEHLVETIKVIATDIVAATGFTIRAFNTDHLVEQPLGWNPNNSKAGNAGRTSRLYGLWTVAWVWN
jgi:hypothetical protein